MKHSKTFKVWLGLLCALVLTSVLNWGVVTGWGNVRISNVTIVGDNGHEYTALVYTPKNATNEHPAPAFLCSHGYSGNARNHESWAMEYARRGFVVLSIDNFGSGDGEFQETVSTNDSGVNQLDRADNNRIAEQFLELLFNMPMVDKDNVVIGGHSMGCNVALAAAATAYNHGHEIKTLILADPAIFGAQMIRMPEGMKANTLWLFGTADKLYNEETSLKTASGIFAKLGANTDPEGSVVTDQVYSAGGYIYQHIFIKDQIHEAAFINKEAIGAQIDFVQKTVNVPNPIAGTSQNWPWKDVLGLIGTVLFAAFLAATACLFIEQVPFFASVKQPLPRNIGLRGVGLTISIVCAIVFPIIAIYFGGFGILKALGAISAYGNEEHWIFRLRFTNIGMGVVIALTLMGMIMLALYLFTDFKKAKGNLHDLGLTTEEKGNKIDWSLIGKAFILAVLVALTGWVYLAIQRGVLRTDFYCLFFGVKAIAARKFVYYIPYIVLWMVCFCFASLSMNVERRLPSTGNETKDTIIAVLLNGVLNCLAVTILVLIENQMQIHKGAGVYGFTTFGTDVTRLWGMPLGMFLGGCGNTYMYRKTGNIWTGAFLFGIMAALMACTFGQVRVEFVPYIPR